MVWLNNSTLRLWSESGEVLQEMVGHTAIVYSVAVNSVGEVASGSEDGEAKVWRGLFHMPSQVCQLM